MKAKPYPRTKPSGVEWLGEVPEHWEVKRFRRLIDRLDQGWSPNASNSPAAEDEIGVLKLGAASKGRFRPEENKALDEVPFGMTPVTPAFDDLLISRANTPELVGDACVVKGDYPDRIVPDLLFRVRVRQDSSVDFVCWFLLSQPGRSQIECDARGSSASMVKLGQSHVRAWILPLPPLPEQRAIAAYLDRETGRIDGLVAKKRELIERLKEKRSALISRTVTRGLPPKAAQAAGMPVNPPMKDSGIEWLGEIPEHWEVGPLVRFAEAIQTGPFGSQLHSADYAEGGIPLINPAHIIAGRLVPDETSAVDDATAERLSRHRLRGGDIVMARRGEIGRCAVVGQREAGWVCGTGSLVIRLLGVSPKYFATVISGSGFSSLLELHAVGTTMLNLNPTIVGRMLVPAPPLPEQHSIAAYLSAETAKLDALVAKVEEAVERLKEYRSALITAAVTGKIDVSATAQTR